MLAVKKFNLKAYLGKEDISATPRTDFPRLREGLMRIAGSHMVSDHGTIGANHYGLAHSAVEVAANPNLVQNPAPVAPGLLVAGAGSGTVQNHRERLERYQRYNAAVADVREQTLEVLGNGLYDTLSASQAGGVSTMDNLYIQTWLHTRIGTANANDIKALRYEAKFSFSHPSKFPQEAAKMTRIYLDLEVIGAAVGDFDKQEQLEKNIAGQPLIVEAHNDYCKVTVLANRTFALMTAAMETSLANISHHTADELGYLAATTRATGKREKDQVTTRSTTNKKPRVIYGPGNPAEKKKVYGPGKPAAAATRPFCFEHGYKGHAGIECKQMLAWEYPSEYLNATGPCTIGDFDSHPGDN